MQWLDSTCRWCRDAVETVDHLFNGCAGEGIKELKESLKVKDATILYSDPEQALLFSLRPSYSHTGDNRTSWPIAPLGGGGRWPRPGVSSSRRWAEFILQPAQYKLAKAIFGDSNITVNDVKLCEFDDLAN
jgi:hypothetical protein